MSDFTGDVSLLTEWLGYSSEDPGLEVFLVNKRIHDRPMTPGQMEDEGAVEDDGDTDVEYELMRRSKESMVVQSERHGFCLIFQLREDYDLVHRSPCGVEAPFVLEQIAFFAKGVQIYQGFEGPVFRDVCMTTRRSDAAYAALGSPLARRSVHETSTDLFVVEDFVLNFGFQDDGQDSHLAHIHIRRKNIFDDIMLNPRLVDIPPNASYSMPGLAQLGHSSNSLEVQDFLAGLGLSNEIDEDIGCPEEMSGRARSHGIVIYFKEITGAASRPHVLHDKIVSAITYKRRGDLSSSGYLGDLPFGMHFGDRPDVAIAKAEHPPVKIAESEQLLSYYWHVSSGIVVQAVFSLIDWQLARVTLHAPVRAASVLKEPLRTVI
ncbi:hypothetical protein VDF98_03705 [Xanthomonas campestris pv. raphani]|uniref:hypothetical protein n=1 Tax=Xanthomonas campestris TaxID=339 RepID=UPI0023674E9A|nr:hypothetical protein [Xanthomonas campestris]MEA9822358.1 hypothetical protein [Xanthomonas campestris pv. raphani]MEA9850909.1 hypothetical protein [Xanthomonas campestris pv. raphani]MEA9855082.1 hypothetical protein [Xanthomonas campestris pv. raphani]MEA9963801.1 hypothetical protein [Xanthomonas campestris pv. raphani]WDJ20467.1 hypothetical protein JH270_10945 [Xanthomonas campestris pv. raphani]